MSFVAGETVGRYRIVEQLGQGGMATVYRAYDANLDRYVAIKVMHQAFKEDPNFLARFRREAQIVARLRHPHIVAIHEFDEHRGQPYLVMEFIAGETLKARLTRQPYTLGETVKLITAVGEALTYAHDQGVLHRDIKPSNILLDAKGTPYLTDFGLARMVQAGESTLSQDMMLGTPQYISPEQAQGITTLSPATDIYSLGIVLYQLVVGRVPFSADTPYAIVHDHIYKPLPLPRTINPNVSPEIERVLLKALAKDPNDRFQSAADLVRAFREAVESEPATPASQPVTHRVTPGQASPPSPAIPAVMPPTADETPYIDAKTPARRRPMLWMLGGLAAFILTCLLGLFVAIAAITDPTLQDPLLLTPNPAPPQAVTPAAPPEIPRVSVGEAQRMVDAAPDDPVAHFALALALLEEGQRLAAQQAFQEAIALAGDNGLLVADAARQAAQMGYMLETMELLAQALTRDPGLRDQVGALMYEFASAAGRREVLFFSRMAENHPDSPGGYVMLARAYLSVQQLDMAEEAVNRALELDGALPEAHLVLGELYAAQDRLDEAVTEWRFAATASDTPPWVVERANALLAEYMR